MRLVGFVLAAFAFVHQAHAADLGGILRGAMFELGRPTHVRWDGFYAGGSYGYSSAMMDFSQAGASLIAFILRESALENSGHVSQWEILGKESTAARSYGAFAGYNAQWDSVILGLELTYNFSSLKSRSSGSLTRVVSPGNGFVYNTTISSLASAEITYGTVRGRAGYVFGNFLGYVFAGVALGQADVTRSATVFALETDPVAGTSFPFGPITETEARKELIYGYALGAGLDWALTRNIFVRGDYEFVRFSRFVDMDATVSSFRGAVGLKF